MSQVRILPGVPASFPGSRDVETEDRVPRVSQLAVAFLRSYMAGETHALDRAVDLADAVLSGEEPSVVAEADQPEVPPPLEGAGE